VTFTEFAMDRRKRFLVPRYYLEGDSLVLMSSWFRGDTMTRLEAKGRPFAFLVFARGTEIATAANVWWIDREGNGTFSELQWSTEFPEVPEWALKRIRGEGR
jgi:hypothetical protein